MKSVNRSTLGQEINFFQTAADGWDIEVKNNRFRLVRRTEEGERITANVDQRGNGSVSHSLAELPHSAYAVTKPLLDGYHDEAGEFLWLPSDGDRPNILTFKRTFSGTDVRQTRVELDVYFDRLMELQRLLTEAQLAALLRWLQERNHGHH